MNKIVDEMSLEKKEIIDKVLKDKANKDAWTLVLKTHIKDGPWEQIYNKFKDEDCICKEKIPNKLIYEFYKENPNEV